MNYNYDVYRRLVAFACALSVLLAWTAGDLSAIALSADAMACCAATDYGCAGMRPPDDCCKTVRHATGSLPSSVTATGHPVLAIPTLAATLFVATTPTASRALFARTFTRPHDPPHLHSFSLLI